MTALEQMCAALSPLAGGGGGAGRPGRPLRLGKDHPGRPGGPAAGLPLVHMDDFFLPPARKTPRPPGPAGGKCDWERVRDQVLAPLSRESPPGSPPTAAIPGRMGPGVPLPAPWCWWRGSTPSTPPCGTSTASGSFWRPLAGAARPPSGPGRAGAAGPLPGGVGPAGGPVFPGLPGPGLLPAGAERSMTRAPSPCSSALQSASRYRIINRHQTASVFCGRKEEVSDVQGHRDRAGVYAGSFHFLRSRLRENPRSEKSGST